MAKTTRPFKERDAFLCTYINSRGDTKEKVFADINEGLAFTEKLDERLERGTCFGYTFSRI